MPVNAGVGYVRQHGSQLTHCLPCPAHPARVPPPSIHDVPRTPSRPVPTPQNEFKQWFSTPLIAHVEGASALDTGLVKRLHTVLRPFILRRLKSEVAKQLPQKHEHILRCRLSNRQRCVLVCVYVCVACVGRVCVPTPPLPPPTPPPPARA